MQAQLLQIDRSEIHLPPPSGESHNNSVHPEASSSSSAGLFSQYAVLFLSDVASRALRFVADIILARHFIPAVFGQLGVAQSLAVQGIGIATCGLDTAGMREVASGAAPAGAIATTVLILRLALGLATWGALAAVAWLVPQYHESFSLVAIYSLSVLTGALTLGWLAQARGAAHVVGLAMLGTHAVYFGGVQLAVFFGWQPVCVPLSLVLAEALTAAGIWVWIVRAMGSLARPLPAAEMLRFLRESLPIGGANIIRGMIMGSDVLLLGLFADAASVGLYSGAFKLYSLVTSLVSLYFAVLLPQLAAEAARSRLAVETALRTALGRAVVVATPLGLAGLLLSGVVLRMLFKPEFGAAAGALQILVLAVPVHLAAGHYRLALVALNRQRQDLVLVAISALVHVAAKVLLIPTLGLNGAALGTFTGEGVLMLLALVGVRSALKAM